MNAPYETMCINSASSKEIAEEFAIPKTLIPGTGECDNYFGDRRLLLSPGTFEFVKNLKQIFLLVGSHDGTARESWQVETSG